jgi:ATP-dependent Lon protease
MLLPQLELDDAWFDHRDLRVELAYGGLPHGSTPDPAQWTGTAAAIVAALVSFVNGHLVRTEVAVTGGLAPDGALLPVTGLKDKVHWAKRGYAQYLVMPSANQTAAEQLSEKYRQELQFVYAADLGEVLRHSLTRRPVSGFSGPA